MLEAKKLKKIYKTKKGVSVEALKGVSIQFPEKGMVFLLGKSGSGKSTLLNLLGGLDKYDDGEIVIQGCHLKSFIRAILIPTEIHMWDLFFRSTMYWKTLRWEQILLWR